MLKADCFAYGRLVVNSLATIAVTASSDFVEEGAVDFIHFSAVDFRETISHVGFEKIIID